MGYFSLMNFSLQALWLRFVRAFWVLPAGLAGASIIAALGFNALDHVAPLDPEGQFAWFAQSPDGARAILTTISGSMITVTGVLLSMMVVVLTLASQQFGPRLVQNFIKDRPSQFVIGAFAGCFIYCIITLKNISSAGENFVPSISVLFALLMSLACIGLMIFFVQHVASAIQVQSIMWRVYYDLNACIDSLFPDKIAEESPDAESLDEARAQAVERAAHLEIAARRAGYLQMIRHEALMALAQQHDLLIELEAPPGNFIYKGSVMARIHAAKPLDDAVLEDLRQVFVVGTFPTHEQDATFPIRQLEEIAIRALSPGINDPHTAEECIDYLGCSMRQLAQRAWPQALRYDKAGRLCVIAPIRSFEELLRLAFQQIFFYGRADITIVSRILHSLNVIAEACQQGGARRRAVVDFAEELAREGGESLPFDSHREQMPRLNQK